MPIEKLESKQRQGRLLQDKLSKELSGKHKLYKLKELINWSELEEQIVKIVNVKALGRERKSLRVMLSLSMLQEI